MPEPAKTGAASQPELTSDEFLGGRIVLTQPKRGFRAGFDSVLLAASVSVETSSLLDLGAGVGTASCCVLADLPDARASLVEMQPDMLVLAQANLTSNHLTERAETLQVDLTAPGKKREAAGLKSDFYSTVIANPPFFEAGKGTLAPESGRADARHMQKGGLDRWVKTAATSAAPRGEVIFIHSVTALNELLDAFDTRFGAITILPIAPRPGDDATRVLVRGIKGSRAPLRLMSTCVLHHETGHAFQPWAEAIFRGKARLDW